MANSPFLPLTCALNSRNLACAQEPERPSVAPWMEIPTGLHTPVRVRWAGDRCSVCDSDVDYDFDQLVSCDACGITVHQSCYGVPEAPGAWLCWRGSSLRG